MPLVQPCSEDGRGEVVKPSAPMGPAGGEKAREAPEMLGGRAEGGDGCQGHESRSLHGPGEMKKGYGGGYGEHGTTLDQLSVRSLC